MKYTISKLQSGGIVPPSFIKYNPQVAPVAPPTSGGSGTSQASGMLDEEVFKRLMQDGGLSSDVTMFASQIQQLESSPAGFLDPNNRASALRLFAQINTLKDNKEAFIRAESAAKDAGALNEVAADPDGRLYVRSKDNSVKIISLEDYDKHRAKYNPMTVSELLNARRVEPQLAFNSTVFSTAGSSVGTNKIVDKMSGIIAKMGSIVQEENKYVNTQELADKIATQNNLEKPDKAELTGLYQLASALQGGTDGVYKVKQEITTPESLKAYTYLWSVLTPEEKNKLRVNNVLSGGKSTDDVRSIVENAVLYQGLKKSTSEPTYQKELSEQAGMSEGSSEGAKAVSPFELLHVKGRKQIVNWNDPSSNKNMNLVAFGESKLLDMAGKPLGAGTLTNTFSTEHGAILDTNHVFFGNKQVTPNEFNKVVYDGEAAVKVYMPVKGNGDPDFAVLKEINELEKQVAEHPEWDQDQINDFYTEHGKSWMQVGPDKQFVVNKDFKPFLMMHGYTTEQSNVSEDNGEIQALDNSEAPITLLNNVWTKEKVTEKVTNTLPSWLDATTYYKGAIIVPYKDAGATTMAATIAGHITAKPTTLRNATINENIYSGNANVNADPSKIID